MDVQNDNDILKQVVEMTDKHYRRFFDDELENNKDIFPKMPFINADIFRGQTRGLKKSWFSFGGENEDESG